MLSILEHMPNGFVDPETCNNNKCKADTPNNNCGNIKCSTKNRLRVGLLTEKPPHIQLTREGPTFGIAPNKLVITVAPQNDIWPQGNT